MRDRTLNGVRGTVLLARGSFAPAPWALEDAKIPMEARLAICSRRVDLSSSVATPFALANRRAMIAFRLVSSTTCGGREHRSH